MTSERISSLLSTVRSKRIAILGDVMIDRYMWGTVNRISPEAPVPVVEIDSETERLGGAANVANNIRSLGGEPLLVGVVGDDRNAESLRTILAGQGCPVNGIVTDPSRPTTIKTRIIAHGQHVVRIDSEQKQDISADVRKKILSIFESQIETIDGIIIEDYNKGVVVKELITALIALANAHGKIITIDPKFNNFFEYKNATVFKPNKKEAEEALGRKLQTEDDVLQAGKLLLDRLQAKNILLTRSEKGMTVFQNDGSVHHIPTKARRVADVSGAGDTVIATLTMMLAAGATMEEAASIANLAGGIVCGEVGIVPIDPTILKKEIEL